MKIEGPAKLIEVYIGESDQWHGKPLAIAMIERLKQAGIAGATVIHGLAGYGAKSRIHTAHILRLSEDLPVMVKIVDTPERAEIALKIAEEMVSGGLITITDTHVVKYVHEGGPNS
jgi:PII-like signaling protein